MIAMKENTHPSYRKVTVKCGCGNTFPTRSTYTPRDVYGENIKLSASEEIVMPVETCSMCHPIISELLGRSEARDKVEVDAIQKFRERYGSPATLAERMNIQAGLKKDREKAYRNESGKQKQQRRDERGMRRQRENTRYQSTPLRPRRRPDDEWWDD